MWLADDARLKATEVPDIGPVIRLAINQIVAVQADLQEASKAALKLHDGSTQPLP